MLSGTEAKTILWEQTLERAVKNCRPVRRGGNTERTEHQNGQCMARAVTILKFKVHFYII
jgi:hypothetical protein